MNVDIFKEELALIENAMLREKIKDILLGVDPAHEYKPASSTGKYHPPLSLGEGGLIRHTKAVVKVIYNLASTRDFNRDNLVAAAILHDMHKYENGQPHTLHAHPFLMAKTLMENGLNDIAYLVESHMGRWNTSKNCTTVLPIPVSEPEWLLHYADYIASRTWFRIYETDKPIKDIDRPVLLDMLQAVSIENTQFVDYMDAPTCEILTTVLTNHIVRSASSVQE